MGVARLRSGTLKSVVTRHADSGLVLSEFRVTAPPRPAAHRESLPEPSRMEMMGHAGEALGKWAASGFKIAPPVVRSIRYQICLGCTFWDDQARMGLGKCRHSKCGCTKLKLALGTEACPLGKWPAI